MDDATAATTAAEGAADGPECMAAVRSGEVRPRHQKERNERGESTCRAHACLLNGALWSMRLLKQSDCREVVEFCAK